MEEFEDFFKEVFFYQNLKSFNIGAFITHMLLK